MENYEVKGKFYFHDDMVYFDDDGAMCYDFIITSDEEPNTEDIRRSLGLHAIKLLPESTDGRLTLGSPSDE
jgi:hypothetical protein